MKIHIFPFSARKGTPAASFPDQTPAAVLKERVERLSALERELARRYYRTAVGAELEVLVERTSESRPGWMRGTDRRYIPVELPGDSRDEGRCISVVGRKDFEHHLDAERLPPAARF